MNRVINGETITPEMISSISYEQEMFDAQPGPLAIGRGEKPTHGPVMTPTGLVMVRIVLKDGRRLVDYESSLASTTPAPVKPSIPVLFPPGYFGPADTVQYPA